MDAILPIVEEWFRKEYLAAKDYYPDDYSMREGYKAALEALADEFDFDTPEPA